MQSELLHSSYTRLFDTSHMNTPQLTFQHEYGQYCNVPFLYEWIYKWVMNATKGAKEENLVFSSLWTRPLLGNLILSGQY